MTRPADHFELTEEDEKDLFCGFLVFILSLTFLTMLGLAFLGR